MGMFVGLDVPQGVGFDGILVAGDFLLLKAPFWKLDLVREEIATLQSMTKSEHCAEGSKSTGAVLVVAIAMFDFNNPVVVRIPDEARETVCGNFILEVDIGNGGTNVMRVKAPVGRGVFKADRHVVVDPFERLGGVIVVGLAFRVSGDDSPVVVCVLVRIESNLLLVAASWVVMLV